MNGITLEFESISNVLNVGEGLELKKKRWGTLNCKGCANLQRVWTKFPKIRTERTMSRNLIALRTEKGEWEYRCKLGLKYVLNNDNYKCSEYKAWELPSVKKTCLNCYYCYMLCPSLDPKSIHFEDRCGKENKHWKPKDWKPPIMKGNYIWEGCMDCRYCSDYNPYDCCSYIFRECGYSKGFKMFERRCCNVCIYWDRTTKDCTNSDFRGMVYKPKGFSCKYFRNRVDPPKSCETCKHAVYDKLTVCHNSGLNDCRDKDWHKWEGKDTKETLKCKECTGYTIDNQCLWDNNPKTCRSYSDRTMRPQCRFCHYHDELEDKKLNCKFNILSRDYYCLLEECEHFVHKAKKPPKEAQDPPTTCRDCGHFVENADICNRGWFSIMEDGETWKEREIRKYHEDCVHFTPKQPKTCRDCNHYIDGKEMCKKSITIYHENWEGSWYEFNKCDLFKPKPPKTAAQKLVDEAIKLDVKIMEEQLKQVKSIKDIAPWYTSDNIGIAFNEKNGKVKLDHVALMLPEKSKEEITCEINSLYFYCKYCEEYEACKSIKFNVLCLKDEEYVMKEYNKNNNQEVKTKMNRKELEEKSLEEVRKIKESLIQKRRAINNKRSEEISYDIFKRNGIVKNYLKYLSKIKEIDDLHGVIRDFTNNDKKLIKTLKRSAVDGRFGIRSRNTFEGIEELDYFNKCNVLLEHILKYQEPYLKNIEIEELCKLAPNCYQLLSDTPKRLKECPKCNSKIRRKSSYCSQCGYELGGNN